MCTMDQVQATLEEALQRVYPAEQQSGTTHQPCKNQNQPPNKTKKKNPLREQLASKQVQKV